jgi:hypothetical protein
MSSYEIGRWAATQMKIPPQKIELIEARGPLCLQLHHLLGGRYEFVETPLGQHVAKLPERTSPVSPICRWYPPERCVLEWVGYQSEFETKAYRFIPEQDQATVFLVEFEPERPYYWFPRIRDNEFMKPPFTESRGDPARKWEREAIRGFWEVLSE